MLTHPFFTDLVAHDDAELGRLLGSAVESRETIHEWPLSWVRKLRLDDGRTLVYKSQLPPTVEAAFYRAATSPLLPHVQVLGRLGGCTTLVVDWIDAPTLQDASLDEAGFVEHARRVVEQIGEIKGDLPVYYDIGTPAAWHAVTTEALGKLGTLVRTGRFPSIAPERIEAVRTWAESDDVLALIGNGTRVVHSDLRADQIFLAGDGYRVIDWQRPILAPADVDLVMLLDEYGIDPSPYASAEAIGIRWFVILRWAVEAQHDLLPHLDARLFDDWAAGAVRKILGQAPG
ncbi:aminoglycoside phosphotransferase family protein [Flindersiella endophytica]